jgi:hypothetical protein
MTRTSAPAWLLALLTFLFGGGVTVLTAAPSSPSATTTTTTTATAEPARPAPPTSSSHRATPTTAGTTGYRYAVARVSAAQLGGSYHDGCPVGPDGLRLLTVTYLGFDHRSHAGQLVVAADWARSLARVFATLYDQHFPIRTMNPVTEYGSSDDASMAADNTSAFNCRAVTGGSSFSEHSYGTAVDLNPVENPYISGNLVEPDAGADYLDRTDVRPGMITVDGPVVAAFAEIGWSWGGEWASPTDFQHFSASGR